LWGIGHDLPYSYYGDENQLIYSSLKFGTGDFNPHWFFWPTLFQYFVFFLFGLFYISGLLAGYFNSASDIIYLYVRSPAAFLIIGRSAASFFGISTIILVYILARRYFGDKKALLAAFLYSVLPLAVEYSHYAVVDTPLVFMITLAVIFILRLYESAGVKNYILSGLFLGLAFGIKYSALFLIVPLYLAQFMRKDRRGLLGRMLDGKIVISLFSAIVAFFAVCPYAFLDWRTFLRDIKVQYIAAKLGWYGFERFNSLAVHISQNLREGLSFPVLVFSLCGLFFGLKKKKGPEFILAVIVPLYFFAISFSRNPYPKFMLPLLPFLSIFAAAALIELVGKIRAMRSPVPKNIIFLLFPVIIIFPLSSSVHLDRNLNLLNTMTIAKGWIEANIPKGSRILMTAYGPALVQSPEDIVEDYTQLSMVTPTYNYHKERSNFYRIKQEVASQKTNYKISYILSPVAALENKPAYEYMFKDSLSSINNYKEKFQYIVITDASYAKLLQAPNSRLAKRYRKLKGFYKELTREFAPEKVFRPEPGISRGPVVSIYKISR